MAIPILLLKTKSSPTDAYQDLLTKTSLFDPIFVPVLQHCLQEPGLSKTRSILHQQLISSRPDSPYGGLIFTSQRAVEAFTKLVQEGQVDQKDPQWPNLQNVPVYSVGPATTRALSAVSTPLRISGGHTGTGEALSHFILDDYRHSSSPRSPLLFLVGETRRDIIPRTLTDSNLPPHRRIQVDEVVVYGTGEMPTFSRDFASQLRDTAKAQERWVVVFSPAGCDGMLREMGLLDPVTGRCTNSNGSGSGGVMSQCERDGRTFVATIGPTTQAHLRENFGFEPDVCAERPSPEGVLEAIMEFKQRRKQSLSV